MSASAGILIVRVYHLSAAGFAPPAPTRPFIAVFNQQHVVVVSGGSWHVDDVNDYDVWDTVIYQDPSAGPDLDLDASTWHENISDMVIGAAATADAQTNFNEYGNNVVLRGSIQHGPYQY